MIEFRLRSQPQESNSFRATLAGISGSPYADAQLSISVTRESVSTRAWKGEVVTSANVGDMLPVGSLVEMHLNGASVIVERTGFAQ